MLKSTRVEGRSGVAQLHADDGARAALEGWIRRHGTLEAAAAADPGAEILQGRGEVMVVPAPDGDGRWVVRHYHRGGAVAGLLGDRYLRAGTPRPVRELRVGRRIRDLGVPTPEHIAAAVYPRGPWYRGDLVTRWVPDSRDLAGVLFGRTGFHAPEAHDDRDRGIGVGGAGPGPAGDPELVPGAEPAMAATGRLLRRLHDHGVDHPDLNLKNVLVTGAGRDTAALVLDLDRARIRPRLGDADRRRMIERFARSVRKWEGRTGVTLPPSLMAAFEDGYRS